MEDRVKKIMDLKKLSFENQKLIKETLTLAWKNQTSIEINVELYLAKLQAENQKLSEEVLKLMKKNNASLEMQSELYKKAIEAKNSRDVILSSQSFDTNVESDDEEIWTGRNHRDGVKRGFIDL